MDNETTTEEKKTVATKKTVKKKQPEATVSVQGTEVTPSAISDTNRDTICLEIQKWKNTGSLDPQRYAKIVKALGLEVQVPRKRKDALSFATELNALGTALDCKTVKGKSCCGQ